jgi:V/A-type H+-transporting ATPase subunit C
MTEDKELTDIFRIKWDFHNLKVLLKFKYLQSFADTEIDSTNISDILVQSGLENLNELEEAVMSENGDRSHLPQYLQEAIAEVERDCFTLFATASESEGGIDPQLIDIILDKHAQSLNYRRASEYSDFLQRYFQIVIDLYNIRNFLRVKILEKDRDFLSKVLLDNGTLKTEFFLNQFEESIQNFPEAIRRTNYYELVTEGIQNWLENHSLATLEKFSDNYLLNYIKPAKFAILGIEPVLGYLLAKEHEIKLLRIIMIGKLNGLSSESIREKLRETYV